MGKGRDATRFPSVRKSQAKERNLWKKMQGEHATWIRKATPWKLKGRPPVSKVSLLIEHNNPPKLIYKCYTF